MFTGVIKLANIDDYIAPSQECVKPIMKEAEEPLKQAKQTAAQPEVKAKITLNDCLACSGCVTTAESLLVEQMSIAEFIRKTKERKVAMFISPQARASLARSYQIGHHQLMAALDRFLQQHFPGSRLFDMQEAIDKCHAHIVEEWLQRNEADGPILCSECPGWVCYAEKVAPKQVIPHMSRVKSPQQIMGSLIRDCLEGEDWYVVGVMPCFDKKLEAIRFEYAPGTKEVDLVLTAGELQDLINLKQKRCGCGGQECLACACKAENEETDKQLFPYEQCSTTLSMDKYRLKITEEPLRHVGDPKCNGYVSILMSVLEAKQVKTKQLRNSDFVQIQFLTDKLKTPGQLVKMAQCFGFRNIQNVVRSIKQSKCPYSYIEIMACPVGCFNGGGQIKDANSKPKEVAQELEAATKKECSEHSDREEHRKDPRYLTEYRSLETSASSVLLNW